MSERVGNSGRAVAVTSLAQIEDKVRRALNLVGEVGLQWTPDARATVIVGDATAPGNATFRGRRFAYTFNVNAGAGSSTQFKATADVVLTSFQVEAMTGTASAVTLRIVDPSVADPFAINIADIPFTERPTSANDAAPLLRSAIGAAASTNGVPFAAMQAPGAVGKYNLELLRGPIVLQAGAKLNVQVPNASNGVYNLAGYVF